MALQVKRAGADEYGLWVKMLVVGDPGTGKTRTASTWPDVLYANCEGGLMSVADRHAAHVDIDSAAQVKELLGVLGQSTDVRDKMLGVPVQTVVIDTLDEIARMLIQQRLSDERKESFAMADWGWLGDQLRFIVRTVRNLDMNVIINVHVKSQEDSETGRTYFKPAIQGAMSDELAAYVDLALLAVARPVTTVVDGKNVRSVARYLQTYPDAQHPWVKDRSGQLPMEFPINFDDDYERLHSTIYASRPEASSVLGNVATPKAEPETDAPARTTGPAKEESLPDPVADLRNIAKETAPEPAGAEQPEPAPEPDPEPTPAEPEPTPESEAPGSEPEPAAEPEPEVTDSAPTTNPAGETTLVKPEPEGTSPVEPWKVCEDCGGEVETKDQADLSFIRHKAHLCRSCFSARKTKKK